MERNASNLRVALVGGYTLDDAHLRGGVQAATSYLVKGLSKINGLELHVLTFRPSGWEGPDRIDHNGVCVHLLPSYPRFERLQGYRNYQFIMDHALAQIQPALIHAEEAASDALVAIRTKFPTVITVHGIRAEDVKYVRSWQKRLRFHFDSALTERNVMRRVKYLIAIGHYVTEYFASLLRTDIHIDYIPNAIDENFFDLHSKSDKPIILFAGRVIPRKKVLDLVHAFAKISEKAPQAELHIAGEATSDPSYVKAVHEAIQQAGLGERVRILGELQENDILREFRDCTLVVLPSSQETTPMVLAQAMAAGKPVIATPVGGVVEMIGQKGERGLLVKVGDIDCLAAAIIKLLQNPAQCHFLGKAGYVYALENYHLDRVARRTFQVYQTIARMENPTRG